MHPGAFWHTPTRSNVPTRCRKVYANCVNSCTTLSVNDSREAGRSNALHGTSRAPIWKPAQRYETQALRNSLIAATACKSRLARSSVVNLFSMLQPLLQRRRISPTRGDERPPGPAKRRFLASSYAPAFSVADWVGFDWRGLQFLQRSADLDAARVGSGSFRVYRVE